MSKVIYGQSGYSGSSRSIRAMEAERCGTLPLTRAVGVVAAALQVTRAVARELLEERGRDEWHHVGKYANECDYYDSDDAINMVEWAPDDGENAEEDPIDGKDGTLRDVVMRLRDAEFRAAEARKYTAATKAASARAAKREAAKRAAEDAACAQRAEAMAKWESEAPLRAEAAARARAERLAPHLSGLTAKYRSEPTLPRYHELRRAHRLSHEEIAALTA